MNKYDKMKFIDYIKPALAYGEHSISVTQKVTKPENDSFAVNEKFYVSGRVYTLGADDIFSVSPTENECGDFSKYLPFITIDNKTFPWERKVAPEINGVPVPWVAAIVISSLEKVEEKDIAIAELLGHTPDGIYFPDKSKLPKVMTEHDDDSCHIIDIPKALYQTIMPSFEDMTYLTHARKINLEDTEDEITANDGEFSVVTANRFIPTGDKERLKSTVHLVSLLGMPDEIKGEYQAVRLVSLHRWNVYSVSDQSQAFQTLINGLEKNTEIIGCKQSHEVLKNGYMPKKHYTRSGEITYSLYRSPLIPHANPAASLKTKHTADGYLIYDEKKGIFEAQYSAAFQLGRLITLSRNTAGQALQKLRKNSMSRQQKKLLKASIPEIDIEELCKNMVKDMR